MKQPILNQSVVSSLQHFRHEYKYIIDSKQKNILLPRITGLLQPDSHTNANGTYMIRSLYFDDFSDSCFQENLSGMDSRSKYRIRYYNSDLSHIVLEKKSKCRGMCLKESCILTKEDCQTFINGDIPTLSDNMPDIKKRLLTEMRLKGLVPKIIVTYERIPFTYSAGNVRVTFDTNITSSNEIALFLSDSYRQRPVMSTGKMILEVKWDELFPRHIKEVMLLEQLHWTAISKYQLCRTYHL